MIRTTRTRIRARAVLTLSAFLLCGATLRAASYFPMSDADLVGLARIAVLAEVVDLETRMDPDGDRERPFTVATLRTLELFKGELENTFRVVIPGGTVGDLTWWVPGAPAFEVGGQALLMLNPLPGRVGEYGLTEFGLSKFDLVADATGRTFLVRPVFSPRQDLVVSKNEYPLVPQSLDAPVYAARDAESFFTALRRIGEGAELERLTYVIPTGEFRPVASRMRPKWGNLGGVELGNCGGQPCMARWYFDTTPANVKVTGSQTHLVDHYPPCGVDQTCLVQAAVDNWHNVAGTDVRIAGPMPSGNFEVRLDLDVAHNGTSWTTSYSCNQQGVVGIGGPEFGGQAKTFKGLSPYYACTKATISMRRWTCNYPSDSFVDILTHEMGHALGLNHPDQFTSVFSTTTQAQWNDAIMYSSAHNPATLTPQADDIQAMQFYYGTAAVGTPVTANFSFAAAQTVGNTVAFHDTSTGGPTGWIWYFGDNPTDPGNVSRVQNPSHTYPAAGTYTVDLIAGNLNGGSRVTKQVTVTGGGGGASTCTADASTLCLNAARFKVTADWEKKDGTHGKGTAMSLTADTGYFWFFSPSNIEVVTKVLKFCSNPFNSYWVFAAGLTDVKTTLTYTDTKNGTVVVKQNPQSTPFVAVQDTGAFPTCP
jgi:PKD repeat protein